MPRLIPIYRDHDESYRADSCQPLVDAALSGCLRVEALRHGHYPGRELPAGVLPGIKMVGYWDANGPQGWGLEWHRNEGLEITFLERGRLPFAADGQDYLLEPDSLTIARPWQLHRVGRPNVTGSRLIWLILDVGVRRPNQEWRWPDWLILGPQDIEQLTNILRHNEQPVWKATAEMRRCFQAVAHAVEEGCRTGVHSRLTLRLNEMFLLLLDLLREKRIRLDHTLSSSRRTVELFLEDLRKNPEHLSLEWNLEEMAESCGLGVTQFVQHVRAVTNLSPVQFLNRCRLEEAARLLRGSNDVSVTDVALRCGFGSSQYFATSFGKMYGCTPREYRQAGWGWREEQHA